MSVSVPYNRIRFTTPSVGIADIAGGASFTAYRGLSTITAGHTVTYVIDDGVNWEVGQGAYDGIVLARTTIRASSNSGSKISLSGTAVVFVDMAAEDLVSKVDGAASSTDNALARWDGTTGRLVQNSIVTVGDDGVLAGGTWQGAAVGVAFGGTGLTTLASGRIPYGNGTSAFQSSASLVFDGTKFGVGGTPAGLAHFTAAANDTLLIRGHVGLSDGASIFAVNSANTVLKGLEFAASSHYFSSGYVGINMQPTYPLDVNGPIRTPTFIMTSPAQNTSILPVGNALSTLTSLHVTGTAASATTREFLVHLGLTSSTGSAATGDDRHKVTLYAAIVANSGSGDVWAGNTVTQLNSGFNVNAHGWEFDINNDSGTNRDLSGLGTAIYGVAITGASANRKTAALHISEVNADRWGAGILISQQMYQYGYCDISTTPTSICISGNRSTGILISGTLTGYAIDLTQSVVTKQIMLRNNTGIYSKSSGGSDYLNFITDNNDKFWFAASHTTAYTYAKLGIGTNGPGAPLQVYGGNATTSTPDVSDIVILSQSINSQLPTSGTIGHAIRIGQTLGDTATLKGNVHGIGIVQTVNNAANITGGVTEIVPFIHLLEATAAGTNSGINYWGSDFNIAGPTTGQEGFMGWVWQGTKYNSGTTLNATHHGSVGHAMVTTPFAGAAARTGQTSYPIDVGVFAGGWSGTSQAGGQAVGATNGFATAFQAGGRATPWMPGDSGWKSKIGTGFYALDHTAYGIKIGTRHADATGQAIYVQSDGGGVGIWRAPDTSQPFVVGGDVNGQRLMWLINASTGSSATAVVRAESDTVTTDMVSGSAAGGAYSQFIGRGSGGVLVDASHASGIIQFRPQGGATTIATVTSTGVGIGTTGPIAPFEINKAQAFAHVTSTSALSAYVRYASSGRNTWLAGNSLTIASAFEIYNETNTTTWLSISSAGVTTLSTLNLTNALGKAYGGFGQSMAAASGIAQWNAGTLGFFDPTSTRIPYGAGSHGLTDSASLTFSGTMLGVGGTTSGNVGSVATFAQSADTQTGIVLTRTAASSYELWLGVNNATGYASIQAAQAGVGANKPLLLNPNGGNVLVGTTTDASTGKLQVTGAIASTDTIRSLSTPTSSWTFAGNYTSNFSVAAGTPQSLPSGAGIINIYSASSGQLATYLVVPALNAVVLLGQTGTDFVASTSPAAGKVGIGSSGGVLSIYVGSGTQALKVTSILVSS